MAEINAISSESQRALRIFAKRPDRPERGGAPNTHGRSFSDADAKEFSRLIEAHRRALIRVARAAGGPERKQTALGRKLVLNSFAAHVCAVLRSFARKHRYASPDRIRAMAAEGKRLKALNEPVHSRWIEKPSGGYRLLTTDGVARTAQRLVYRDLLSVLGIDSEYDYSRRGKGEKVLLTDVCKSMDSDHVHWWYTPDVRNYFASLKPGHFGWLPFTRYEIRNILFTPKCARVWVLLPKTRLKQLEWLRKTYPGLTLGGMVLLTMRLTRQGGLPQGAVHSPLLARGFMGRELRTLFGDDEGIVCFAWIDDLTIGARLKKHAQAAKTALTERLKSHPAGSVLLHPASPSHHSTGKVAVLGYFLEPGNGVGGTIHVKPGPKRCGKFRNELGMRLLAADPGDDHYAIAETYRKDWYAAQQAWTKVPIHSEEASRGVTMGYVTCFLKGFPMEGNWSSSKVEPAA